MEQVLIDIGHRARVRVHAWFAATEPHEPRRTPFFQMDRDPRLQDAIAFGDDPSLRIDDRLIEDVSQRAGELPCGITRQQRVGVERDDVLHVRERRHISHDQGKRISHTTTQQGVEITELSSLSLVAHPRLFLSIPAARTMEQEEDVCGFFIVGTRLHDIGIRRTARQLLVEFIDPGCGQL